MTEVDFRVFRDLSYGLYVVTSRDGEKINGQIVIKGDVKGDALNNQNREVRSQLNRRCI
jgi:hypothetical protein